MRAPGSDLVTRLSNSMVAAALLAAPACRSPEVRACAEAYSSAQEKVRAVDAKSKASVVESLGAVEAALATCRTARRHDFIDQLTRARNELKGQVDVLDRRARFKPRKAPTAEELRRLEKEGDPSCPRGQAYRPEGAKEIRCTGPLLVEMNARQATAHFEERDYNVRSAPPSTLELERGNERVTLVFPRPGGTSAPDCVVLHPAPGTTWQEAVARATGANPARLEIGRPVQTARGALAFDVDEKNVVIRIGSCAAPSAR